MERRKFLNLGMGAVALTVLPGTLMAEDHRATKPNVWTAKKVEDAIKSMYGNKEIVKSNVKLTAPDVASNGGAVPVNVKSKVKAKTVSIFQDANPEAAVIVFDINKNSIINYDIKMKMKASGTITVIVEGIDGKLYVATKEVNVALGGCEG